RDAENLVDPQGFSFEGYLGLSSGEVSSGECVEGVQLRWGEKIGGGSKDILVTFANDLRPLFWRAEKINVVAGQGDQLRFDEALEAVELVGGEGIVTHGLLNSRSEAFGLVVAHAIGDGIEERSPFRSEQGALTTLKFLIVAVSFSKSIGQRKLALQEAG